MTNMDTTSAAFFEAMYRADPDPWNFQTSRYELGRYQAIVRALAGRRYHRAFEPGCSLGVLTELLATLADRVDACDFSQTASSQARARCAHFKHVDIRCAPLTGNGRWHEYDLIVLSEIGYYFTETQWRDVVNTMVDHIAPGTTILAAHWLGHSADHLMSGDDVHRILEEQSRIELVLHDRTAAGTDSFRLDVWRCGV